jgi:hypothetical protein
LKLKHETCSRHRKGYSTDGIIEHRLTIGLAKVDQPSAAQTINSWELPCVAGRRNADFISAEPHQRQSQQPSRYTSGMPSLHLIRKLERVKNWINYKEEEEQAYDYTNEPSTDYAIGPELSKFGPWLHLGMRNPVTPRLFSVQESIQFSFPGVPPCFLLLLWETPLPVTDHKRGSPLPMTQGSVKVP